MKLYETITAENWRKHSYGFTAERRCLVGHLVAVDLYLRHRNDVMEAVRVLFPERVPPGCGIPHFNDHPDTTLDDVLRVCKLADV